MIEWQRESKCRVEWVDKNNDLKNLNNRHDVEFKISLSAICEISVI